MYIEKITLIRKLMELIQFSSNGKRLPIKELEYWPKDQGIHYNKHLLANVYIRMEEGIKNSIDDGRNRYWDDIDKCVTIELHPRAEYHHMFHGFWYNLGKNFWVEKTKNGLVLTPNKPVTLFEAIFVEQEYTKKKSVLLSSVIEELPNMQVELGMCKPAYWSKSISTRDWITPVKGNSEKFKVTGYCCHHRVDDENDFSGLWLAPHRDAGCCYPASYNAIHGDDESEYDARVFFDEDDKLVHRFLRIEDRLTGEVQVIDTSLPSKQLDTIIKHVLSRKSFHEHSTADPYEKEVLTELPKNPDITLVRPNTQYNRYWYYDEFRDKVYEEIYPSIFKEIYRNDMLLLLEEQKDNMAKITPRGISVISSIVKENGYTSIDMVVKGAFNRLINEYPKEGWPSGNTYHMDHYVKETIAAIREAVLCPTQRLEMKRILVIPKKRGKITY